VKRGQLSGEDEVLLPTGVSFKGLLCRVDGNLVKNVKRTLENFATFVEGLSENGKHYQVIAELENLAHMKSCVDEMLDKNGLNF
jgi:hypothetical protein